jgi:hypothetical protein
LRSWRDGQTFRDNSPAQKIRTIVPEGIAEFLFFNGENIDHLAMEESSAKVAQAIRVMLGPELIQTTIDDLNHGNVRGKFMKELRENTSEEKQALLDEELSADSELSKIADRRHPEIVKEIDLCEKEVLMINHKLEANREAAELQLRRGRLVGASSASYRLSWSTPPAASPPDCRGRRHPFRAKSRGTWS